MGYLYERKNSKGKVTSHAFLISNYPDKPIRQGGFRTKGEAEATMKYIERKLKSEKELKRKIRTKHALLPFYIEYEQWYKKKKSNLDSSTINDYKNTTTVA